MDRSGDEVFQGHVIRVVNPGLIKSMSNMFIATFSYFGSHR